VNSRAVVDEALRDADVNPLDVARLPKADIG